MSEAGSGHESSKDLIETVAPQLSLPVKRVPGGTAAHGGDGAEISDTMVIIIAASKSS